MTRARTAQPPLPTDYGRLEMLYEIQTVLAQPIGTEQACVAILPIVTRALRVRTAVLLDVSRDVVRVFQWGAPGLAPAALEVANDHARTMLEALVPGDLPAERTTAAPALLAGGTSQEVQPSQFVTLPLLARLRGPLFGVFQLEGAQRFVEHDLLFINAVANQLAVALDRHHTDQALAVARAELEQANRRLVQLQQISHAALAGTSLDESLSAVLQLMCSAFDVEAAAVLLASGDGKALRREANVGLVDAGDTEIPVGSGAAGRIAAREVAMFFNDLSNLEDPGPELRANRIRSLLGAPMRVRGRLIGVVYVASRDDRQFGTDALRFIELVADRIGMIIDNANLYTSALAAIRSRDAVMSVVSHDLRNPLSAIHLSAQLFPKHDPDVASTVAIINRSVDVMGRLISDMRDVSNIEAGQLSIRCAGQKAYALIDEAVEGVLDAAGKRSVLIEKHLPARDLMLDCDRVRIIQVLTNLLSNAIKFTPLGGTITVSVEEEEDHACFSVQDTGCGISERDLRRIFDRYWQAEATAHLGTGLGLAIAKAIVEAHGGTMSVTSKLGGGTTFSFRLRLRPDAAAG